MSQSKTPADAEITDKTIDALVDRLRDLSLNWDDLQKIAREALSECLFFSQLIEDPFRREIQFGIRVFYCRWNTAHQS